MRSRYEVRAQKELEAEGYHVDNKAGMSRWSKNRDFWNTFDLVAKKEGEPLRWISIKGTQGLIKSHIEEIKNCWLPQNNIKELWARRKAKKRGKYWNKLVIENVKVSKNNLHNTLPSV